MEAKDFWQPEADFHIIVSITSTLHASLVSLTLRDNGKVEQSISVDHKKSVH